MKNGLLEKDPLIKVVTPKTSKRLPVFIGETEMKKLFTEIEFEDSFVGKRDQLILELFYSTGMRLAELIELRISAVDMSSCTLKVLGKRNKERIIPFGNNIKTLLQEYLVSREELRFDTSHLFITEKGKKLYPKLVYGLVNSYLSTVTTASKKSPHVLRHTFATHMLNNGADLNTIKEILGHANLSATQVYTHNTIEKLKNIHKQAHPKA